MHRTSSNSEKGVRRDISGGKTHLTVQRKLLDIGVPVVHTTADSRAV